MLQSVKKTGFQIDGYYQAIIGAPRELYIASGFQGEVSRVRKSGAKNKTATKLRLFVCRSGPLTALGVEVEQLRSMGLGASDFKDLRICGFSF